ncbi:MAG: hypothetical protein DWQ04_06115, partial [Chloroflexi bacterium]
SNVQDDGFRLLVLDDYHKVETTVIHNMLQFWLDHAPPNLHLVIITRKDPPLTLSRLRVRGQMTEIRVRDLRFTIDEAVNFLGQTMGLQLTTENVTALEQRTEGWIAGLQLAAIALQAAPAEAADFIQAFSGSHHYVIDYLVYEVLRQQRQEVRDFLRETAVLDRFTADLCDAVTVRSDSQSILAQLEQANLFLVPLDGQRRWYRYHHLLADSLRAEWDQGQQQTSHQRAAAWFAAQGLYAEAIRHADAARDMEAVLRLVKLAAEPAFEKGNIRQIVAWLKKVPQSLILATPELGVFWLMGIILTGNSQDAPAALALLEAQVDSWQNPRQEARLLAIKSWVADIMSSEDRAKLARQAAAAIHDDDPLFKAYISVSLGHAHLNEGKPQKAVAVLKDGLVLSRQRHTNIVHQSIVSNLIHALNHAGRRRDAFLVCRQALADNVDAHGNSLPSTTLMTRAWLHYEANELDMAWQDLRQGRELLQQAYQNTLLTPLEVEMAVRLHEAAGEIEKAQAAIQTGLERAVAQQYRHGIQAIGWVEAELNLRLERKTAVTHWLQKQPIFAAKTADTPWQAIEPAYEVVYLTYVRLLLAEAKHKEAKPLLDLLADSAAANGRLRSLISIHLLQAVVEDDALTYLRRAIQQAAPEWYLRLVIDECRFPAHGPQLIRLLQNKIASEFDPAFVDTVLTALPSAANKPDTLQKPAPVNQPELVEPLTEQELTVLGLLVDGLSNREIAQELVITLGTAKWHVHNIYQKLGVNSRTQAIARTRQLQLI